MKKIIFPFLFSACIISLNISSAQTANKNATKESKTLVLNLKKLLTKGIMFGHQDDLAYGVGWKNGKGTSDVKTITGEYPAVYGWEFSGLEKDSKYNIDSVPFDSMRQYIKTGYKRGGVITVSWHLDNPVTGKNAWDTTHGGVTAVMPGGAEHDRYKSWLDKVAAFSLSLKGSKGELIPVLFRPFHELTGNWFWWTKNTCTPQEFKDLWKFTFNYLTGVKKVNNFIFVYNTAGDFTTKEEFLERYPGDDYVDMVSFDAYQFGNPENDDRFVIKVDQQLTILDDVATQLNKIPTFGETGYEAIPYSKWWTQTLWKALQNHQVSYVLLWRNHGLQNNGHMHYYVPYKGQVSVQDFMQFSKLDKIFFEKKTKAQNLYKSL